MAGPKSLKLYKFVFEQIPENAFINDRSMISGRPTCSLPILMGREFKDFAKLIPSDSILGAISFILDCVEGILPFSKQLTAKGRVLALCDWLDNYYLTHDSLKNYLKMDTFGNLTDYPVSLPITYFELLMRRQ